MKNTIRFSSLTFFTGITFLSNIFPILGPSLISSGVGFNKKRFKKNYEIKKRSLLIAIMIGNLLFFLITGIVINYIFIFTQKKNFWLIISLRFLINLLFYYALF